MTKRESFHGNQNRLPLVVPQHGISHPFLHVRPLERRFAVEEVVAPRLSVDGILDFNQALSGERHLERQRAHRAVIRLRKVVQGPFAVQWH